ncbi:MAG: translation elongation factor Ts [Candidatus Dadabacteria bacterium]|nr:MAG: translation elongation factor Ts [Candidatus Dadabacteria bacterium]
MSMIEKIKELRERTGAGMSDCKAALAETDGDIDAAIEVLRSKGIAKAAKKSGREASEGLVGSYIHGNGRIGVLVEVNCETDFVARTEDFQNFVREIAMQVAATNPLAVNAEGIDPEVLEAEKRVYREQAAEEGKPAEIAEKIVEGRIRKFLKEQTLLDQEYIRDPDKTIQDLLNETIAKLGENILIRRFVRFELGEGA